MAENSDFVDYYKILGARPDGSADELARNFHRLARKYHPDNLNGGDRERFDRVVTAHNALKDPAKRAEYDQQYERFVGPLPSSVKKREDAGVGEDVEIQARLLSVFYGKRRKSIRDPGVPDFELERIFGCSIEELEFHLWYLKAKGWIERLDNGMLAITVAGVDHVNAEHQRKARTLLLMDRSDIDDP
jgi:curved DNA-binding protein CbpA